MPHRWINIRHHHVVLCGRSLNQRWGPNQRGKGPGYAKSEGFMVGMDTNTSAASTSFKDLPISASGGEREATEFARPELGVTVSWDLYHGMMAVVMCGLTHIKPSLIMK